MQTLRARRAQYTPGRLPRAAKDKTVTVVDDSLPTSATMVAEVIALLNPTAGTP